MGFCFVRRAKIFHVFLLFSVKASVLSVLFDRYTTMNNNQKYISEVSLNSASGVGVMLTRTTEPFRCIHALRDYAFSKELPFYSWNVRDGWTATRANDNPDVKPKSDGQVDPYKALKRIMDVDGGGANAFDKGVCVMSGLHHWMGKHPAILECLRHYVADMSSLTNLRLILVVPESETVPEELQHDIPVVDFLLPDRDEVGSIYNYIIESSTPDNQEVPEMYNKRQVEKIVSSASGMTQMEIEVALSKAIVENKPSKDSNEPWHSIPFESFNSSILKSKTEIVKQSEVLELMEPIEMSQVGGLENYKEWINTVSNCLTPEAIEAGVDKAKGVVVVGPPGCLGSGTELNYRRGSRNSGRKISLRNLYLKFNGERCSSRGWDSKVPTYLQSFDPETGMVRYNEIEGVTESGVKHTLVLVTEFGRRLILTPNHPVLTLGRGYVECSNLQIGEKIIVRGSMKPSKHEVRYGRKKRVVVEGLKFYSSGWVKTVKDGDKEYSYKRQHRARLVIEARMNGMSYDSYIRALKEDPYAINLAVIGNEFVVHHIDENPMNDDVSNLVVMLKRDHDKEHTDESNFKIEYTKTDTVRSVKPYGPVMTYDIQMRAPLNNFLTSDGLIVHNTGKTLLGKTTGTVLNRPLARVDISKCFAGIVGQSEGKARAAIKQLEAMAPVVALIDEVDKALGGAHKGGGDSGVSQRVLGIFLTAMQESKADIFWILTANRVGNLPSEMLRKGRMDEVFAVLPPNRAEREAVFKIHLKKRKVDPSKVSGLAAAIDASKGYVSAEIEAAVKEAKKVSFQSGKQITGDDLCHQLSIMKPISEAFPEDFAAMEQWAKNNARNASLSEDEEAIVKPVVQRTRKRGVSH